MAFPLAIPLIAAGVTAGASIYDQINTNKTNRQINEDNNEFNAEQAQLNRDFQLEMFNRTNDYNDPRAVYYRYRQAGLNPYLMMQNGAGISPASAPAGAQASSQSPIPMQRLGLDSIGRAINDYQQTVLNEQLIRRAGADATKSEVEAGVADIRAEQELLQQYYDVKSKRWTSEAAEQEFYFLRNSRKYRENESQQRAELVTEQAVAQKYENAMFELKRDLLSNNVRLSRQQYNVLDVEIKKGVEQMCLLRSQKNLTDRQAQSVAKDITTKIINNGILAQTLKHNKKALPLLRGKIAAEIYSLGKTHVGLSGVDVPITLPSMFMDYED